MALRNIRVEGDPILRKRCREVEAVDDRLSILISDMIETMYDADGVGLAAPQVGILKRLVVIDTGESGPLTLINPEIVSYDGEQEGDEGCLSLPGLVGTVIRPYHVVCKAYDENMREIMVEGEELLARAICHELDHLDGILYKDKAIDGLYSVDMPQE